MFTTAPIQTPVFGLSWEQAAGLLERFGVPFVFLVFLAWSVGTSRGWLTTRRHEAALDRALVEATKRAERAEERERQLTNALLKLVETQGGV
jgi:hypothetical protein